MIRKLGFLGLSGLEDKKFHREETSDVITTRQGLFRS